MNGFTANVIVETVRVSGGRLDTQRPYVAARLQLSGHLTALNMSERTISYSKGDGNEVSITVDFEEEVPDPYIGGIWLRKETRENGRTVFRAAVEITLPYSVFGSLAALQGRAIRFETIHDRDAGFNGDGKFADVRRAYFESSADDTPPTEQDRRWRFW